MPDVSALYPQPVQPQSQQNNLLSNPGQVIGLMGGLQDLRLKQQQFNALSQQPAAALQGQDISNQTSQMKQNEEAAQITAHYFSSLPDDAKPEDIYKLKAAIRAVHPNISAQTINTVADVALRDPKGLSSGLATLRLIGVPSGEQVGRVAGPPSAIGEPTQQSVASSARQRGPTPVALSPKEAATQSATGSGAGSAINEARLRNVNYPQEVFGLESAIPSLEKLGPKGTGPGTETINHLKSWVISNVPGVKESDFDGTVKDYDVAKKYLTDFARQNGDAGTNDKLAAAFASNPSVNISNAAAISVAKSALTLRRLQQARTIAFETSGKADEDYPKEAGKWNREHDPRAYGFDLMSAEQRKKTLESLPAGKREMFMMDVQDALKNGIIKAPK